LLHKYKFNGARVLRTYNPAIEREEAKVDKMIGAIAVARQFRPALSRNFGHGLGTLAWG
jgi:hypothetical protein